MCASGVSQIVVRCMGRCNVGFGHQETLLQGVKRRIKRHGAKCLASLNHASHPAQRCRIELIAHFAVGELPAFGRGARDTNRPTKCSTTSGGNPIFNRVLPHFRDRKPPANHFRLLGRMPGIFKWHRRAGVCAIDGPPASQWRQRQPVPGAREWVMGA